MEISKEKKKEWEDLLEHSDITQIQRKLSKYTYSTIFNAVKKGKGKLSLIIEIDNFFKNKKKQIDKINNVDND